MKQKRSVELYPDFSSEHFTEWAFIIPKAYMSALDMSLDVRKKNKVEYTIWTQGENFNFKEGDVFYDHKNAYKKPWGEALNDIQFSLQIKSSEEAIGEYPGLVNFDVFCNQKKNLVKIDNLTCSQDEFVMLLQVGLEMIEEIRKSHQAELRFEENDVEKPA